MILLCMIALEFVHSEINLDSVLWVNCAKFKGVDRRQIILIGRIVIEVTI